jgi:hypothetical protein
MNFLYRALNEKEIESGNILVPKSSNEFSGSLYPPFTPSADVGNSTRNAIKNHQTCSNTFPSKGISTTANYEIALGYAKTNKVIAIINRDLLKKYSIEQYVVKENIHSDDITKHQDDEVILVYKQTGALPKAIIHEIKNIT